MAKKNEVAIKDEALTPDLAQSLFSLKENMESIEARLPQIEIIHKGQMFVMPEGQKTESFTGIILDMNRANAWWATDYDTSGGGTPPDCFSLDGFMLDPSCNNPQSTSGKCADCPQNKFGSAPAKKDGTPSPGKACKNMKRIHIWLADSMLPYRLTAPPSSLKAIDTYVSLLVAKALPYQLVNTEFSLKEVSNKTGITYSEIVLREAGKIESMKAAQQIKAMRSQFLEHMRGQAIEAEEYYTAE